MKKKIITCAIVIACAISAIFNLQNLNTIKAAQELKEGAHIGACYAARMTEWDVFYYGE